MAETSRRSNSSSASRQPSRLQRRAPASLKISPAPTWNIAIPLLSPLVASPTSSERTLEVKAREQDSSQQQRQGAEASAEKVVFKKWQHPAAPFYYEPAPMRPSFVPVWE